MIDRLDEIKAALAENDAYEYYRYSSHDAEPWLRYLVAEVERHQAMAIKLQDYDAKLEADLAALRQQLPENMQHCTILFRSCLEGHGWLTAKNWAEFGCPTCEVIALRQRHAEELERAARFCYIEGWNDLAHERGADLTRAWAAWLVSETKKPGWEMRGSRVAAEYPIRQVAPPRTALEAEEPTCRAGRFKTPL